MIGKTVSHYKITRKLGAGGMGVVYEAVDTKLDRTVALKFLPPDSTRDPGAKARFVHEAKAASAIDHPNVCSIYEIDETEDGHLFLAMARYEGETLKDRIERGPLPIDEALDINRQVAEGLAEAHARDIVHRDIKPANIFLTAGGMVKILDFGLAKLEGLTQLTQEGTTLGTAQYMSPEQAGGQKVDHRSDLWCLGVVLYEAITGRVPFQGDHAQAVVYAILNRNPEPVTGLRTGVPLELERIIGRCLAKNPEERYQTARDVRVDLQLIQREHGQGKCETRQESVSSSKWKRIISPGFLATLAAIALLGLFGAWKFFPAKDGSALQGERAMAVMDFQDISGSDNKILGIGLTELVNIGLVQNSPIRIVSSEYIQEVRRKEFGSGRGGIDTDQALELARQTGASLLLTGQVGRKGEIFYSTWRLVDTSSGKTLGADRVDGGDQFHLADSLVEDVLPMLASGFGSAADRNSKTITMFSTDSPEAYHQYVAGVLAYDDGLVLEALSHLEQALILDPGFALAAFTRANYFWILGEFIESRECLDLAWGNKDRLGIRDRMFLVARKKQLTGQVPGSFADYQSMLALWPDDIAVIRSYAQSVYWWWYFKEAIPICQSGLELVPADPYLSLLLAECYRGTGRLEEALSEGLRLAGDNPENPDIWRFIGNCRLDRGSHDEAETAFKKANGFLPAGSAPTEMEFLVPVAYGRGDLITAEEILTQISKDSSAPINQRRDAIFGYGLDLTDISCEQGKFIRATGLVEEAGRYLENQDDQRYYLMFQAEKDLQWGFPEKALVHAEHLLEQRNPGYSEPFGKWYRALALVELGNVAEARSLLEDLEDLDNKFGVFVRFAPQKLRAEIAIAEGDFELAQQQISLLKQATPVNSGVMELEARAFSLAGKTGEAEMVYREMLRVFGGRIISHYHLGVLYHEAGRLGEAKAELEKFLELWAGADPGSTWLEDARKRLRECSE